LIFSISLFFRCSNPVGDVIDTDDTIPDSVPVKYYVSIPTAEEEAEELINCIRMRVITKKHK
jgi:hypothetical protein